jgi:hypothetical protein
MKTLFALAGLFIVAKITWGMVQSMAPEVFAGQPFQIGFWVMSGVLGVLLLGRD